MLEDLGKLSQLQTNKQPRQARKNTDSFGKMKVQEKISQGLFDQISFEFYVLNQIQIKGNLISKYQENNISLYKRQNRIIQNQHQNSETIMASKSKNPSQNQVRQPQPQPISNKSVGPWTFGYPQCINKKQSRLVCLHGECQKYPFFCSACEDQSCEHEHQHKDKIFSIGFKELIRRLITQRKPPEDMTKSADGYKTALQQLLKNVTEFVKVETKSVDEMLKKTTELQQADEKVVQKLRDKNYQQIKGKQLDNVWNKVAQTEHKKKLQKQAIQFINSKKLQVQEITQHFRDGLKVQSKPQNTQSKSQASNVSQSKK